MTPIENSFMPGDTITFRMTTGEEVIAKLAAERPDCFFVESPLILMQGQQGLDMVPALFSGEIEQVPVYKTCIMMASKTKEDAADHYRQKTTGIKVPPAKQIITG